MCEERGNPRDAERPSDENDSPFVEVGLGGTDTASEHEFFEEFVERMRSMLHEEPGIFRGERNGLSVASSRGGEQRPVGSCVRCTTWIVLSIDEDNAYVICRCQG